ncbi:MAG TPA: hypothetical protein VE028_00220 [Nitratidesulfovibrio sp.]|nr:hypothetical protein [Nitratidesulfovibrio sp.]
MYKNKLRASDQYFGKGVTLPANATAACPNVLVVGAHGGSLALEVEAANGVNLAAGKKVIVTLQDSADGTTFATLQPVMSSTFASALAGAGKGTTLMSIVLPDCRKYLKVQIGTDDATAVGTVDAFLRYLAR